jgi:type IV pilus assembly protein PilB
MPLPVSEAELREVLVSDLEIIDDEDFQHARVMARRLRVPIERAIVERTRVPYRFLLEQIAIAWGVSFIDLKVSDVKRDALKLLPEDFCKQKTLLAYDRRDHVLHVAMEDPRDRRVISEIERRTGLTVLPVLSPGASIQRALLLFRSDLFELIQHQQQDAAPSNLLSPDVPAPELVMRLLEFAVVSRASDIHVEPYEVELLVRYRIDGALQEVVSLPASAAGGVGSRIKVLAGMRLDEKRTPQDGRFEAAFAGLTVDFRVSTLPTLFGEKIVLRVLSRDGVVLDLQNLGLSPPDHETVLRHVLKPFGMVLITGPTGSGKTTSLYALLMRVGAEWRSVVNISTIEDPIEYTIPRVTQTMVNHATGMDFASGLRALLRQDPDVIMVGEIRDRETAEMGVRAALVGRLLLSTLHTNDSTSAVPRLIDMGVEPYLLSSTLSLVVAQRLARRLCTSCRQTVPISASARQALEERPDYEALVAALRRRGVISRTSSDPFGEVSLFRGRGCPQCNGTGFRGRVGFFEVFEVTEAQRRLIMERRPGPAIRAQAVADGMVTLFQDGVGKALLGETTLDEVFRAAM